MGGLMVEQVTVERVTVVRVTQPHCNWASTTHTGGAAAANILSKTTPSVTDWQEGQRQLISNTSRFRAHPIAYFLPGSMRPPERGRHHPAEERL